MIVYLDTSSLVKLYVEEEGADQVRALAAEAQAVATSLVAYPELRAAMARRRREGALLPADYREAKRAVDDDWARYLVVAVTRELAREAGDLAERHRLRGFDSLHLASFAEVARSAREADVRFSSFDRTLNRAAVAVERSLRRQRAPSASRVPRPR